MKAEFRVMQLQVKDTTDGHQPPGARRQAWNRQPLTTQEPALQTPQPDFSPLRL